MPVRPRNPKDPDFPHGSKSGAKAGCRNGYPCPADPTCAQVGRALARAREQRTGFTSYYQSATLRRHLNGFIAKGWAIKAIAAGSGVFYTTVSDVLSGRRPIITAVTAHALRDVTEDDIMERWQGDIPIHYVAWMPGSLYANGWRIDEIARRMRPRRHPATIRPIIYRVNAHVDRGLYDDLAELFNELGGRPGDSRDARRRATLLGYRTPDAYAPDGTLWEDDVRNEKREERWARRDREALLHMQVARMAVKHNMSLGEMAKELRLATPSVEDHTIRRARKALGLDWDGGKAHGPKPGQEARIAEILDVVERWRLAGPLADPHPFCVELGMMDAALWTSLDGKPKLEAA